MIILSPAKSLDFESKSPYTKHSKPLFLDQSKLLIEILKKKNQKELSELMGISGKIAELNYNRYQKWNIKNNNSKQAIFAFNGTVYRGFDFENYNKNQFELLQSKVRILSGLHGILRPLDLIQPYRLEMGTRLPNKKGKNLYSFWKDQVTNQINKECKDTLINLASNEYSEVINKDKLVCKTINIIFKDYKNGKYKTIGLYAKKARGLFANFIIKNNVKNSQLKDFKENGYRYDESSSNLVFLRK